MAIEQIWIMAYNSSMKPYFLVHNTHLQGLDAFKQNDPQLCSLQNQPYIYIPALLSQLPLNEPGIYTLSGARQIGKTTLLKQWMLSLLERGVAPNQICFLSGELISDYHVLLNELQAILTEVSPEILSYIIIDEVTYIKDWDKAIKYAADAGLFRNSIILLSGSDMVLLQSARMRFPGRRGLADIQDYHLYPLSFREFLQLKTVPIELENIVQINAMFNEYLQHGGYLTAINNLAKFNTINNATLATYSDWIRGDVLMRGKQERHLKEILAAIIKCYGSQVTWHSLADFLSIEHPATVADYIEILSSMDAVFVQYALLEDKLTAAPKKARKVMFTDPFIYHAIKFWLTPSENAYASQILPDIEDTIISSQLVESIVVTHFQRFYPTYYIKAEGEIDVAYLVQGRFWPIEIKWRNQLRPKGLKQLLKYPNAIIWAKQNNSTTIDSIPVFPLPLALAKIE